MLRLSLALLLALSGSAVAAPAFVQHIIHDSISVDPAAGYIYPYGHHIADADGDGDRDIFACHVFSDMRVSTPNGAAMSVCSLFKNNGAGVFTEEFIHVGPGFWEHITSADIDNDGWHELFAPNNRDGGVYLFVKDGADRPWGHLLMAWRNIADMARPYDAAAAPLDPYDGCEDVVVGGYNPGKVVLYKNPCLGSGGSSGPIGDLGMWQHQVLVSGMVLVRTTKVFQSDTDGRFDVLIASEGNPTSVTPLSDTNPVNHGAVIRILRQPAPGLGWTAVNVDMNARGAGQGDFCDMDGDGDSDVVMPFGVRLGLIPESMHRIDWYENQGAFFLKHSIPLNIPYAFDAACGNLDSDSQAEIAYTAHDSGSASDNKGDRLGVLDWNGSAWVDMPLKTEWTAANDVTIADMDGDGKLDLVATADEGNTPTTRPGGRQLIWLENVSP